VVFGLVVVLLAATAGGFAFLYFNQVGDIQALKVDMKNLKEEAPAANGLELASGGMSPDIARQTALATVRIDIQGTGFIAVGSGAIISDQGYILTNQHVVDNAISIQVSLVNGDSLAAQVVAADPQRDLALLKLVTDRRDFSDISLGEDAETLSGIEVMAVGYPLGLTLSGPPSFTAGIVSAVREVNGLTYIQTDAAINSGNSGGPLVNLRGQMLGVCTGAILDDELISPSMGLAVPVSEVRLFICDTGIKCAECHG
jgi:S1-C subfamily serine protease